MFDLILLARLRGRESHTQLLYIFRVLGVDVRELDWATYSYGFYVVGIALLWGIVSWSAILHVASALGNRFSVTNLHLLAIALTLIAMIMFVRALKGCPFLLPHGDLEILASTPISRRAIAGMALIPRQVKSLLLWGFAGSVIVSFLHLTQVSLVAGSLMFGLWGVMVNAWSFTLAVWRVARPRRPRRFLWAIPFLLVPALIWQDPLTTWPAHWVTVGISSAPNLPQAELALITLWAAAWIAMLWLAGHLNLITIQESSELYADVRSLGTAYLANPQLVQDMRQRSKMRSRRARSSLPNWDFPEWEIGRFVLGLWRNPRQALVLLEIALLLRSGILLVFGTPTGLAWIFWLFICYRMNRGGMTLHFQRDYGDAFIRQFWPDTAPHRAVFSTMVPFFAVTVMAYGAWLILPLGVAWTAFHALFLLALIVAWHLSETTELVRKVAMGSVTGGREARTLVLGIMLFLAIPGHQPGFALWVPAILIIMAGSRYRQQLQVVSSSANPN